MSRSDTWIHCFSHGGFLISLSYASKSKHSSMWAVVSPLKETLENAPEPVPSPGASARGCVVLTVQAGGCLPEESPGAALPGISRFHAKALALPEAHWALERPPAQGGLLVHTLPRSHLCWPSRAKSSRAELSQAKPSGVSLPWAGWGSVAGSSTERNPLQASITTTAGSTPASSWERIRICAAPASTGSWALLPTCVGPNPPERASENMQWLKWRERFTIPQAPVPGCVHLLGVLMWFWTPCGEEQATSVFSDPPMCQCRPFQGMKRNLGAEVVIFFPFLCFPQPQAVPALRCACTPPSSLIFPPHCQSSMFSQGRSERKHHTVPCGMSARARVRLAAAAVGVRANGSGGGMGEGRVRAAMLETRTKALWWVSAVNSTARHEWHNSARETRSSQSSQGTLLPPNPHP